MTHAHIDYAELIQYGWKETKKHFWVLTTIFVILYGISAIFSHIPIIGAFVSVALGIAIVSVLLDIVEGRTPTYSDLWKPFKTYHVFLNYILVFLILFVYVLVALLLLALCMALFGYMIAGILAIPVVVVLLYYALRIQFYKYLLVEHPHMKPFDSLTKSMQMTKGHMWKIVIFTCIMLLLNLIGALCLLVGLLVTIPTTALAFTKLYRILATSSV